MKLKPTFLALAVLLGALPLALQAEQGDKHEQFGQDKAFTAFVNIEIRNHQGKRLGRIKDVAVDLINGRIAEVLVSSGDFMGLGGKIVAVPPLALVANETNDVYFLNISEAAFDAAPAINLSKWVDSGRSDKVAAAYRHFGQEPYFLLEGETAHPDDARPKVPLGYIERTNKLVGIVVGNHQGEKFGKVRSLTLDIPKGRINNVVIVAPGNLRTKTIVPAMALDFNPSRTELLLDDTKEEFADESRYFFTPAANGQPARYVRESYQGPHASVPLVQGNTYFDLDRTTLIIRNIRLSRVNGRNVEVATNDGRVTLRGWVYTEEARQQIGEIAIAAARLEIVDNQITVGRPVAPGSSVRRGKGSN